MLQVVCNWYFGIMGPNISYKYHLLMYGIFVYIWLLFMVNVGKYSIH